MGIRLAFFSIMIGVMLGGMGSIAMAGPALPGQKCQTPPYEAWSGAEKWAWTEICEGRIADFNRRYELAEQLDPNKPDGWDDETRDRQLSPAFLETVLLHEPWRSTIPRQGVRIVGALFSDALDLAHARLHRQLWLEYCVLESAVNATGLRVDGWFSLEGSSTVGIDLSASDIRGHVSLSQATFKGDVDLRSANVSGHLSMIGSAFEDTVDMDSLKVAGSLFMRDGATFKGEVNLGSARVNGELSMAGSTFEGVVNMSSLEVASHLFMHDKAAFKGDVILRGAKVGGQLEMEGSSFEGVVNMDSLEVAGSLFMRDKAAFKGDVTLISAKVGGQLAMAGSAFEGVVDMDKLKVGGHLFMDGAIFAQSVYLLSGELSGDLDLSGAELTELDLSTSRIAGELRLGSADHEMARWAGNGRLVLRNAHASVLQDRLSDNRDAWPRELQLDGFTYGRLGGFRGGGMEADMVERPVEWYITWLERDPTYTPQPHRQLAEVFRAAGHPGKASAILYAGRERERTESAGIRWWGLSLLKWTIGYGLGYRYFQALFWVAGLVVVGAMVLRFSGEGMRNKMPYGIAFSLDHLLPIVKLRSYHYDVELEGWARYYFYAHKLMGYVLASFLLAGLSGLTQQ
jgi:cytoskeletal protein CcmA (bactofilin family)